MHASSATSLAQRSTPTSASGIRTCLKGIDLQLEVYLLHGQPTFGLRYLSFEGPVLLLLEEQVDHRVPEPDILLHDLCTLRFQLILESSVLGLKRGGKVLEFGNALICGFLFLPGVSVRGRETSVVDIEYCELDVSVVDATLQNVSFDH